MEHVPNKGFNEKYRIFSCSAFIYGMSIIHANVVIYLVVIFLSVVDISSCSYYFITNGITLYYLLTYLQYRRRQNYHKKVTFNHKNVNDIAKNVMFLSF